MSPVTLILCIHNHQPVGNLPEVFEQAYRKAYRPFLDVVESFPNIKFVLHNTGPLLEWYEENAPDYIARVRELVDSGQVEILTGGFYEPILAAIPERDALGQIRRMTDYAESAFGVRPRGMWLAERVWEPHIARTAARAGVEYLPVDDYAFRLSGVPDDELVGYFMTEDQGAPLKVFPISKVLRYTIPFQPPDTTIAHLRSVGERGPGLCAVFGDDGEKFGVWPGTHRHVYDGGWLERFLGALTDNGEWLRTATFSEFIDEESARGRVYLPTSSYPEMMEWALPTNSRRCYERLMEALGEQGALEEWGPFVSGGLWRGFISKYDESNTMTRKMIRVSEKLARMERTIASLMETDDLDDARRARGTGREPAVDPEAVEQARTELWRGQCNCAYWHGVFGGLYLPHLRSAIYEHLIRAEDLLDSARGARWDFIEVVDHDLDGNDEVLLESHWANVYVAPARGGTVFEFDIRRAGWNVLATMSRYEEAYHKAIGKAPDAPAQGDAVGSIHDSVAAKDDGLERFAVGDAFPRRGAIDHFLAADTKRGEMEAGTAQELGDFVDGRYEFRPFRGEAGIGAIMQREGTFAGTPLRVEKAVRLTQDDEIIVEYSIRAEKSVELLLAPEWNLAFLTDNEEYVYLEQGGSGRLSAGGRHAFGGCRSLRAIDLLHGEELVVECDPPCTAWTYPLETASQSESGLERVFQGTTLVTAWELSVDASSAARCSMTLRAVRKGG